MRIDPNRPGGREEALWQLLDDIDTLDDAVGDDDAAFRALARQHVERRHDLLHSNGYTVHVPHAGCCAPVKALFWVCDTCKHTERTAVGVLGMRQPCRRCDHGVVVTQEVFGLVRRRP